MISIIHDQHGNIISIKLDGEEYSPSSLIELIKIAKAYKRAVETFNGWYLAEQELLEAITILERGIQ